jgi:Na+(H+)/acetate symporter ActP
MQFLILLLGALVFVFYQFEQPPVYFNQAAWHAAAHQDAGRFHSLETQFAALHAEKQRRIRTWLDAKHAGNPAAEAEARSQALAAHERSETVRAQAKTAVQAGGAAAKSNEADYVFITFILDYLPHGVIGLLVAAFFAAALSSKSAELNALGSTTTVDFYRHVVRREASDAHYVAASRWFTLFWGLVALAFALFAHLAGENLIQAVNIVGSLFYGVVLGLFLVAFFLRRVGGTAVFWSGLAAQLLVFVLFFSLSISYLWYNFIGCAACVLFSLLLQAALGPGANTTNTQPQPANAGDLA